MPFNLNNRDHVFHFCRHLDQYSTADDVPPPIVVETYLSLSNLCRKYLGSSKYPSDAYTFIYLHIPAPSKGCHPLGTIRHPLEGPGIIVCIYTHLPKLFVMPKRLCLLSSSYNTRCLWKCISREGKILQEYIMINQSEIRPYDQGL